MTDQTPAEKPAKTAKKPVKKPNTAMSDWLEQHPLSQTTSTKKRGKKS